MRAATQGGQRSNNDRMNRDCEYTLVIELRFTTYSEALDGFYPTDEKTSAAFANYVENV